MMGICNKDTKKNGKNIFYIQLSNKIEIEHLQCRNRGKVLCLRLKHVLFVKYFHQVQVDKYDLYMRSHVVKLE